MGLVDEAGQGLDVFVEPVKVVAPLVFVIRLYSVGLKSEISSSNTTP